jgi:hypothetical protein
MHTWLLVVVIVAVLLGLYMVMNQKRLDKDGKPLGCRMTALGRIRCGPNNMLLLIGAVLVVCAVVYYLMKKN